MTALQKQKPDTAPRSLMGDDIYDLLLSKIVSREFAPGVRLSVDGIARELSVSQTPIRQAMSRLCAQGLVVNRRNAGFFAAPLPSKDVFLASLEFRLITEPAAAALCARNASDRDIETLGDLLQQMHGASSGGPESYGHFSALDLKFHDKIAEASGNPFLQQSLLDLRQKMVVFRMSFAPNLRYDLQDEHVRLFAAIEARDEEAARAVMHEHIAENIRRVIEA